jgi:2-polyprenyl-6-methoxyphenol hydroxylase-like FAD-dependent oxidoreductase
MSYSSATDVCAARGSTPARAKGGAASLLARGIGSLTSAIEKTDSRISGVAQDLQSLDQVHLLDVSLDRLTRWSRPGLLAIGDAAHAMSPMGGIGINLAIQDAVAAANALVPALQNGGDVDALLAKVQRRRSTSTWLIQAVQKLAQDWVLSPMLDKPRRFTRPPWPLVVLELLPALRRLPGRAIALGIRSERVESHLAAKGIKRQSRKQKRAATGVTTRFRSLGLTN